MSGVRIPSLTPLKPQVRRPGRDRGRAVQHDHRPSLGADLRISAAHGGDFWEPILRPTLRGQPELLPGRWVTDPGGAGTLSPGPRICLIDRPLRRLRPAATVKRSATLKIQNSMVTHTVNASRQREAAIWWPSRYGQEDEVAAPNEIPPGRVLEEILRGRARVHAGHSPRQAPRRYRRMGRAPGDRLSQVTA